MFYDKYQKWQSILFKKTSFRRAQFPNISHRCWLLKHTILHFICVYNKTMFSQPVLAHYPTFSADKTRVPSKSDSYFFPISFLHTIHSIVKVIIYHLIVFNNIFPKFVFFFFMCSEYSVLKHNSVFGYILNYYMCCSPNIVL